MVDEPLPTRELAPSLAVSSLGFGGHSYRPVDDEAVEASLRHALDLGITFFDSADVYGDYRNEEILGRVVRGRRDQVVIGTKFGLLRSGSGRGVDGSPAHARKSCEGSLRRLGVDHIDVYYLHRPDVTVPIEESVGAMAELVTAGKVRHLGLCEASAATIRRASAVHPIAVVQSEWSVFTRAIEREVLPACRELGIAVVPFSPLGRGMLTGALHPGDLASDSDYRRSLPRFNSENLDRNMALVASVKDVADRHGCSTAQVALAWLLAQGDDIVPIPGTTSPKHLEDNVGAIDVRLEPEEIEALNALRPHGSHQADLDFVERDTPPLPEI